VAGKPCRSLRPCHHGDLDEYLNPKSTFKPIAGDVNPLNAADNEDFMEVQELLEAELAGRGEEIQGGKYVEGGLRAKPQDVAKEVKLGN